MKKVIIFLLTIVLLAGGAAISYASDWDKAGKALTIVEGLRLLTGGRVDLIGSLTGVGRKWEYADNRGRSHRYDRSEHYRKRRIKHARVCTERVWVPHYKWQRKHIPAHEEYDEHLGEIFIEDHYVKYKVEHGGHWETTYNCH